MKVKRKGRTRGLARGASAARKAVRRAGATRKKRQPPAGFSTWRAYMASIRPGAKRAASHSGGSTVARKRGRRKATTRTRRNPSRAAVHHPRKRSRRRARRNPPATLRNLPGFAMSAGAGALGVVGGKIIARKGRALTGQAAGSVFGMVAEAGIGIVAGALVASRFPSAGHHIAVGGIVSPLEAMLTRVKLPLVGDALGADDYYLGYSEAVDQMSAGGGLAGYVEGNGRSQFGEEEVSRYVAGNIG